MQMECLEHYAGRDVHGAGLRRGIALAPSLAAHATEQQSKQTGILKERRKAREEKAAAKSQPAGVCVCVGGKPRNRNDEAWISQGGPAPLRRQWRGGEDTRGGKCMWAPFSRRTAEISAQRAGGGESLRDDVLSQQSDGL